MKNYSISYFVVVLLLLSLISCKEESSTEPETTSSLYPLKVANVWTYDKATNLGDYEDIYLVEAKVSDTIFKVKFTSSGSMGDNREETIVAENKSDGYYQDGTIIYKYPAEAGDTYQSGSRTITVIATNVSITVPAGTFNCIEYESGGSTYWVSPGVGQIKWSNDQWNHSELISYTLN